jgi:lipopolysaccharide transport system permease protein
MRIFRGHISAFRQAVRILTRNRDLMWEMARREVSDRYVGQAFGLLWAVGHPLFMMGLYVFIFAFVFKNKIGGTYDLPRDYTTYILAGLIPWMAFQDSMAKSCAALTGNAALVKQVVFPLEILPAKSIVASLAPQLISLVILLLYVLARFHGLAWTYFLLPVLLIIQWLAMVGVGYILSSASVYFRDIKDFIQLFALAGMYLMPIVYLPGWVPALFKPFLYVNPFSYMAWCYQDALYYGRFEHPLAWFLWPIFSVVIFVVGYRLFRKLKPGFGNVL